MNEDTLVRALGGLRTARMSETASDRVREELENAWRERASRQSLRRGFVLPGFARAFAIAALVVAVGFATLRASADSPLYSARIAIEDALVGLQADPISYVSELYEERLEEAAHFEAAGNALAASRAREAQEDALRLLNKIEPQVRQEQPPEPSASTAITLPSPSPTPESTVEPSPSPTPTATPTMRPATPRPATPPPAVTDRPATPKPTPSPTPTQFPVHVMGTLTYADSSPVNDACVSATLDGSCIGTQANGQFEFWIFAKKGDTIAVYVRKVDLMSGRTLRGKDYGTVTSPTLLLGNTTLR
ncbi:MAG TPA: hypothetical protein VGR46_10000 [Candidatus Limnocylindria bacterium]|nr:hypothetical protein [Candidatus Limnocylindria bacterium]